ncbi:protein kinase domain-containing protein [Staphylothermus hellenicus]|uniref:non-specific serine/threonine protein kinase n=1 Tax=Staphylothermus hellenicus (strain DSM 12710 / JCM 10830 / BK20S6-10-b1 / P8) TaxID=591019 RepID=D7DB43_STAHD|nr:protein kinase [Staphylothermus hellenicus]ADI31390.1 serine/threonine protein kinase [Staphylothermus hellenicus DSM 12710]
MVEFKPFTKIDKASKEFIDPVVLSYVMLKQKIIAVNKRAKLVNCLNHLKNKSVEVLKQNSILYVVMKSIGSKWTIRSIIAGTLIIAMVYETKDGVQLIGGLAYNTLSKEIYPKNPVVKYSVGVIPIDALPDNIKVYIEESLREKREEKPPYIWVNKVLYDLYIEKILTDKGAYMYVLLGRDKFEHRYAVKIPREKTVDGKPLAVNTNTNALNEVLKGIINSLEVYSATRDSIRKGLASKGYDEYYADQLILYRKYILRPRAIIMLRTSFSDEEYLESPPIILEDYANLGDLDTKIKSKPLDQRELAFLAVRLAGALALVHINHFIHMDIKPQNILLIEDGAEPYGYAPLLGDFVGLPHVFDSIIELKKSTPEYADPIALVRGRASYNYDVYSLGITLFYAATGKKLKSRILLNLLTLKNIYGTPVPLRVFLVENPELVQYARKLEALYHEYNSKKHKMPVETFVTQLLSIIEDYDREQIKIIDKALPSRLANIIKKSIILNETDRYQDSVSIWLDLLNSIKELGYTNLIPS